MGDIVAGFVAPCPAVSCGKRGCNTKIAEPTPSAISEAQRTPAFLGALHFNTTPAAHALARAEVTSALPAAAALRSLRLATTIESPRANRLDARAVPPELVPAAAVQPAVQNYPTR